MLRSPLPVFRHKETPSAHLGGLLGPACEKPSVDTLGPSYLRWMSSPLRNLLITVSNAKLVMEWGKKCLEITSRIETLAFGRGYYLAMGFGQAELLESTLRPGTVPCSWRWQCPYPLQSRPSMESSGIDVFQARYEGRMGDVPDLQKC